MKKMAMILSVIMLITFTAGMVFAEEEKAAKMEVITGKVVDVDAASGNITIMANDEEQTLQAEPKMLEGIEVGQKVNIEKSEDVIKSIKAE